jgi:hypothetical protein
VMMLMLNVGVEEMAMVVLGWTKKVAKPT